MELKAHFSNIHKVIIHHLEQAQTEIVAAVAWFTDHEIFEVLCKKSHAGIRVSVALIGDEINQRPGGLNFQRLTNASGQVIFLPPSSRDAPTMHHKFCVIDRATVITGSYNWSQKARSNDENITVVTDSADFATKYLDTFDNLLLRNGQLTIDVQLKQDIERRQFAASLKQISAENAIVFLASKALNSDLIGRFADHWNWEQLSWNRFLPWSIELIERYEDRWDWWGLSENKAIPWSLVLIKRFEGRWDWKELFWNGALPSSLVLILIERYVDRWDWGWLSGTKVLPWSLELIECFEDRWQWWSLSGNRSLPWSIELIERYEDRWDWTWLSGNTALPWSIELFERYEDRWDWGMLSGNTALPWSIELLERYEDRWLWLMLSGNTALPWSIELFERHEDRWDWGMLSDNAALPVPLLCASDIAEVMAHHFSNGGIVSLCDTINR